MTKASEDSALELRTIRVIRGRLDALSPAAAQRILTYVQEVVSEKLAAGPVAHVGTATKAINDPGPGQGLSGYMQQRGGLTHAV